MTEGNARQTGVGESEEEEEEKKRSKSFWRVFVSGVRKQEISLTDGCTGIGAECTRRQQERRELSILTPRFQAARASEFKVSQIQQRIKAQFKSDHSVSQVHLLPVHLASGLYRVKHLACIYDIYVENITHKL